VFEEVPNPSKRIPPYSTDLAPSDSYLFEKVKGTLPGQEFGSTQQLLLVIKDITGSIGRGELESAFDAGQWRLSECVEMKREYMT
jgi:hypothetical protein